MEELTITESAEKYLDELLGSQEKDTVGIKIFVSEPGTPRAETCIAYAKEDESLEDYLLIEELSFSLLLEKSSLDFIKDAVVDYSPDKFGGTLTIKAPNAKLPQINENASIEDKETAVLQFGGGCQGCGMVDLTLKDGVEKTLLEQVDGLKGVMDVTDHSYRENAYYK